MKKKLAMRVVSLAICVVFTGMLFGAPKSKAVVTETAVGTAALAGYMTATGIPLTVINGGASTVTAGVASMASSYATATGAAASGSAWLSSLAAGCSISPAGLLVLSAAAVVAIGAFVAWFISENDLISDNVSVDFILDSSGSYLYNGICLPPVSEDLISEYGSYLIIFYGSHVDKYELQYRPYQFTVSSSGVASCRRCVFYSSSYYPEKDVSWSGIRGDNSASVDTNMWSIVWANYDVMNSDGSVYLSGSNPVLDGEQLSIERDVNFVQPDLDFAEDDTKEMQLDFGAPLTSLDDLSSFVPEQVANNTISVTYEIVDPAGEGAGDGVVTPDTPADGEIGIYIPILSDILSVLKDLADAILGGIQSLFTPSQTAIDALSAEVDSKLPFIPTLQGFGDDLVYNLEHPEECADGLGLTTVVDLGKGRGTYLGNTKHELLDVSWYLEYKPLVDDIIVGFCWLVFLWNCYGALPRIIHGEGSITGALSLIREEEGP